MSDASRLTDPGPRMMLRPASPKVPVTSVGATKQDVSNHRSIVGLDSDPSQIRFGRLPVPVDCTPCVCVIVNGSPPRKKKMPLICQPPYSACWAHGTSYTQL